MLGLGDVIGQVAAKNGTDDIERIVAVLTGMQTTINQLVDVAVEHKREILALQVECRRLKARTDAPVRSNLLRV